MARPRQAFRGRSGPKRRTQWIGPAIQSYVSVATGGATLVASFPITEQLTIVRVRGQMSIRPASVSADVDISGAMGIGIVSDEALAAGVVSIPEPFTDADWSGWLMWRAFTYHFEFGDGTGVNFPNWTLELDSKAMRRVGPNESLVVIAESESGAYQLSVPLRVLVKLA